MKIMLHNIFAASLLSSGVLYSMEGNSSGNPLPDPTTQLAPSTQDAVNALYARITGMENDIASLKSAIAAIPAPAAPIDVSAFAKTADFEIMADRLQNVLEDLSPPTPVTLPPEQEFANMTGPERAAAHERVNAYSADLAEWKANHLDAADIAFLRKNVLT